jgi:hypothetical protein
MNPMATLAAAIPRDVDEDPHVQELVRKLAALEDEAQTVRDRQDRFTRERDSLGGEAATVLLALGKAKPRDIEARDAQLRADITTATADLERTAIAIKQVTADLRGARDQARGDIAARLRADARQTCREMNAALATFTALAPRLEQARPYLSTPQHTAFVVEFAKKWSAEARRFGLLAD